jgi:PIN domain nuclease of toxin-antitoxin system
MILCDTHVIVWDVFAPKKLSQAARRAIARADADASLYCADISLWELGLLAQRGRLPIGASLAQTIDDLIAHRAFRVLAVTPRIAARAMQLDSLNGDPADALITATALVHDAALITADKRIAAVSGLRTIW